MNVTLQSLGGEASLMSAHRSQSACKEQLPCLWPRVVFPFYLFYFFCSVVLSSSFLFFFLSVPLLFLPLRLLLLYVHKPTHVHGFQWGSLGGECVPNLLVGHGMSSATRLFLSCYLLLLFFYFFPVLALNALMLKIASFAKKKRGKERRKGKIWLLT